MPNSESFLSIPSFNFEGMQDYMWICPAEGFLVSTATLSTEPFRVVPIECDYVETETGLVEVKRAGSDKWMTHGLRREEGVLWWTIREKDVRWVFVSVDTVPKWAHDVFAKGAAKLKKIQETEQGAPSNR